MIQMYVVVFRCFSFEITIHAGNLHIELQNYMVFHCTYLTRSSVSTIDGNFHQNGYHFKGRGQY